MERKKKIRRAFILTFWIYIIINLFIFGLMKAFLNTNNIINRNQIIMASVSQNSDNVEIKILGKKFNINKNKAKKDLSEALLYFVMPYKLRTCTEIIIKCEEIITEKS